jgi:hypothetical protein
VKAQGKQGEAEAEIVSTAGPGSGAIGSPQPGPAGRRDAAELAGLTQAQREQALARWRLLRAHLEDDCPLARVAAEEHVPERTLRRWLAVL